MMRVMRIRMWRLKAPPLPDDAATNPTRHLSGWDLSQALILQRKGS